MAEVGAGGRRRGVSWSAALRWVFGLAVLGLVVWLLVTGTDWGAVADSLVAADYGWLALALAAILGTFVTRGLRWRALFHRDRVGLVAAITAILVGQAINAGLPVARSGDVARAVWVGQREPVGVSQAIGTIVLEKVWDLLALCAAGLVLLLAWPLPAWFSQSTWAVVGAAAVGLGALYLGLAWQRPLLRLTTRVMQRLSGRASGMVMPRLEQLVAALDAARQPQSAAKAGIWTFATWALGALANWAVMRAFGVGSWPGALFLEVTLMLGGAAVPTPGRIGVFEGITVVSLGQFGVAAGPALAIGVVLHAVVLVPALVSAAALSLARAGPSSPRRPSPVAES